jgi:hypothetical protein
MMGTDLFKSNLMHTCKLFNGNSAFALSLSIPSLELAIDQLPGLNVISTEEFFPSFVGLLCISIYTVINSPQNTSHQLASSQWINNNKTERKKEKYSSTNTRLCVVNTCPFVRDLCRAAIKRPQYCAWGGVVSYPNPVLSRNDIVETETSTEANPQPPSLFDLLWI